MLANVRVVYASWGAAPQPISLGSKTGKNTGQLGSPDHCDHAAPRGLWGGSKPSQTAEGHSTSA
eukprot:scaffold24264_cov64-Phaeocystis_antarctica.AAC.1